MRVAVKVAAGDLVSWEIGQDDSTTARRVQPLNIEYLRAVEGTLGEWASNADEKAYHDL